MGERRDGNNLRNEGGSQRVFANDNVQWYSDRGKDDEGRAQKYSVCFMCMKVAKDTVEHMFWGCEHKEIKKERGELYSKWGEDKIKKQANCTRLCGILTDHEELNKFFAQLSMEERKEYRSSETAWVDEVCDNLLENSDSEGNLMCAGDGAAPGGQKDMRGRRSGGGLYYGEGQSINVRVRTSGTSQGAQRAETEMYYFHRVNQWTHTRCT